MVSDWFAMVLAMGAVFSEWCLASYTSSIEIKKNMQCKLMSRESKHNFLHSVVGKVYVLVYVHLSSIQFALDMYLSTK